MFLSDQHIEYALNSGRIKIVSNPPLDRSIQVQPASLDLRLGGHFVKKHNHRGNIVVTEYEMELDEPFVIDPGEFVLGHTLESVGLVCPPPTYKGQVDLWADSDPMNIPYGVRRPIQYQERVFAPLCAWVEGRSSIGREGVAVHITAGFIDPGFEGQITLEICNVSEIPFTLVVGMRICQLVFAETTPVRTPYGPARGSKYLGQMGATKSKLLEDR